MAIGIEIRTLEGLQTCLQKANKLNTNILYSSVVKMNHISPLSFYMAGRDLYLGERFFWKESMDDFAIAGLGKVDLFQAEANAERYSYIEEKWRQMNADAILVQENKIPGTGPLLFGGFSFDYQKSQSMLWDQFGDNFFYVPQYMITLAHGAAYLTININCSPGDDMDYLVEMVKKGEELANRCQEQELSVTNRMLSVNEVDPEGWKQCVREAVHTITETDMNKIVLARERRIVFEKAIRSEDVLAKLMEQQGTSFIFSIESGKDCFVGASPERLVKKQDKEMLSTCLAGSIARGMNETEDDQLGRALLTDPKNLVEHGYVVSMIKQSLEEVCTDVKVPAEPVLMKLKFIQHLYTPVTAICPENISLLDVVKQLHPTPALGGLPKQKAVDWIRAHERLERGLYGGPLGWMDAQGNGEYCVALRSALLQGKEASLFAGCGIVQDSVAEEEYKETEIKFKPMITALGGMQK
ncbi:isochorismate synthase [Bacillus sp. 1P06AnD]|uniref:isochorismate synthase n=1 Tax=Bacillus sp. 1P06AnD TaxID=3132208 RepID=UPI00399F8139